jgi:hypothetical protein
VGRSAIAVIFCLCVAISHADAQATPKKIALVIGNAAYQNIPALRNAGNDARDMAASLERIGFLVLLGTDADRRIMRSLIDDFNTRIRGADIALFYYSGHGVQMDGENYLVPVSADVAVASDVPDECIPLSRIVGRMDEAGAGTNIIILDACRDNPFKAVTRGIERGLSVVTQKPPESIIVYATAENEKAEDGTGRNGTFTGALLANLERKEAFADILLDVKAEVRKESADRQKPAVFENLTHHVYLAGSAPDSHSPSASAPETTPPSTGKEPSGAGSPFAPLDVGLSVSIGGATASWTSAIHPIALYILHAQLDYVPRILRWFGVTLASGVDQIIYDAVGDASSNANVFYVPVGIGPMAEFSPFSFLSFRGAVIPELLILGVDSINGTLPSAPPLSFCFEATVGFSLNFSPALGIGTDLVYNYYSAFDTTALCVRFFLKGHFVAF